MSKKKHGIKTNAVRIIENAGIGYDLKSYDVGDGFAGGVDAAEKIGIDEDLVYKTLVAVGTSKEYHVFVIPVARELDLKKAARAAGEKKVEMIHLKDLTAVTGYIKGGCSPVGMKKQYPVIIDDSALEKDIIYVSAGKPGYSMGVEPDALASVTGASFVSLTTDNQGERV